MQKVQKVARNAAGSNDLSAADLRILCGRLNNRIVRVLQMLKGRSMDVSLMKEVKVMQVRTRGAVGTPTEVRMARELATAGPAIVEGEEGMKSSSSSSSSSSSAAAAAAGVAGGGGGANRGIPPAPSMAPESSDYVRTHYNVENVAKREVAVFPPVPGASAESDGKRQGNNASRW